MDVREKADFGSKALSVVFFAACIASVGCGGARSSSGTTASAQPSASSGSSADDAGTPRRPATLREAILLGHYSTLNGSSGFVLDRTGAIPLVRLDGSRDVVELTQRPGPYQSTEFVNDQFQFWIRISDEGDVLFDGPNENEGTEAVRDANANPLR